MTGDQARAKLFATSRRDKVANKEVIPIICCECYYNTILNHQRNNTAFFVHMYVPFYKYTHTNPNVEDTGYNSLASQIKISILTT